MTHDVSSAACIVCERERTWAVHLTQLLRDVQVAVCNPSSLDGCWAELSRFPASVLLLDSSGIEFQPALDTLQRIRHRYPEVRCIVAVPRDRAAEGWLFREAGAIHVVESIRQLQCVARAIRRHIAKTPVKKVSMVEQINSQLPWSR